MSATLSADDSLTFVGFTSSLGLVMLLVDFHVFSCIASFILLKFGNSTQHITIVLVDRNISGPSQSILQNG